MASYDVASNIVPGPRARLNVPELVELRKVSAVICLQRNFRSRMDRRSEKDRMKRLGLAGFIPGLRPASHSLSTPLLRPGNKSVTF
jgi:hypothetical protein